MLKYFLFLLFFWMGRLLLFLAWSNPLAACTHWSCALYVCFAFYKCSPQCVRNAFQTEAANCYFNPSGEYRFVVIFLLQYIFRGCAQNILPPMCSPPPHHPPHPPQPHYLRLGLCAPPPLSLNRHSIKAVQRPLSKYFSFLAPLPLTKIKLTYSFFFSSHCHISQQAQPAKQEGETSFVNYMDASKSYDKVRVVRAWITDHLLQPCCIVQFFLKNKKIEKERENIARALHDFLCVHVDD